MTNSMGGNGDDKNILQQIQHLISQNHENQHIIKLLEHILNKNSIFIIVFDNDFLIKYHNIPVTKPVQKIKDFDYLIGNDLLDEILSYIRDQKIDLENLKRSPIMFNSSELSFELFYNENDFILQLAKDEKRNKNIKSENVEVLDQAANRLDEVYDLTIALEKIRNIYNQNPEKSEELKFEIREQHIPALAALKKQVSDPVLLVSLDIIETNLKELIDPEEKLIKSLYKVLTPSEIQIAEFIRKGKSTRDIADALDIATKTVENHRNNLRSKLGITNKGVNLRSYLMQLTSDSE